MHVFTERINRPADVDGRGEEDLDVRGLPRSSKTAPVQTGREVAQENPKKN